MAEVTVKQLAQVVGTPVEKLLEQLSDAGIAKGGEEDSITDSEKFALLSHLREARGSSASASAGGGKRISLKRKRVSELKADPSGRKRVNVEVRSRRTYARPESDAPPERGRRPGAGCSGEGASRRPRRGAPDGRDRRRDRSAARGRERRRGGGRGRGRGRFAHRDVRGGGTFGMGAATGTAALDPEAQASADAAEVAAAEAVAAEVARAAAAAAEPAKPLTPEELAAQGGRRGEAGGRREAGVRPGREDGRAAGVAGEAARGRRGCQARVRAARAGAPRGRGAATRGDGGPAGGQLERPGRTGTRRRQGARTRSGQGWRWRRARHALRAQPAARGEGQVGASRRQAAARPARELRGQARLRATDRAGGAGRRRARDDHRRRARRQDGGQGGRGHQGDDGHGRHGDHQPAPRSGHRDPRRRGDGPPRQPP